MVPKLRGSIASQISESLAKSGPPVEAHAVHEHMPVMRGMAVLRGRVYGVVAARDSERHKVIAATGLQSGRVLIRSAEDGCLYSVTDRTGAILDAVSVVEDGQRKYAVGCKVEVTHLGMGVNVLYNVAVTGNLSTGTQTSVRVWLDDVEVVDVNVGLSNFTHEDDVKVTESLFNHNVVVVPSRYELRADADPEVVAKDLSMEGTVVYRWMCGRLTYLPGVKFSVAMAKRTPVSRASVYSVLRGGTAWSRMLVAINARAQHMLKPKKESEAAAAVSSTSGGAAAAAASSSSSGGAAEECKEPVFGGEVVVTLESSLLRLSPASRVLVHLLLDLLVHDRGRVVVAPDFGFAKFPPNTELFGGFVPLGMDEDEDSGEPLYTGCLMTPLPEFDGVLVLMREAVAQAIYGEQLAEVVGFQPHEDLVWQLEWAHTGMFSLNGCMVEAVHHVGAP